MNKEVKHKGCELKQRSVLQNSQYYVLAYLGYRTPSFHLSRPSRSSRLMSEDRLD